jgi:hypothetical protein
VSEEFSKDKQAISSFPDKVKWHFKVVRVQWSEQLGH